MGLTQIADGVDISIKNPSPYYITLTDVSAAVGGKEYKADGQMVAPFGSITIPLNGLKTTEGLSKVTYSFIDDQGANVTMESAK